MLSVGLSAAVIAPYRAASWLGVTVSPRWPLSVYVKYPFAVLYNDQFDRLSAPLEKRYHADEVRTMLERAGLHEVRVQSCYGWIAEGSRPA
jgi:hypothetical protein